MMSDLGYMEKLGTKGWNCRNSFILMGIVPVFTSGRLKAILHSS